MRRNLALGLFVLVVAIGGAWLFVLRAPKPETENGKIHVVASFYPLAYITSVVGGDLVSVRTLVPAGAEPHDFEPSSRDFIEIGKANILLYNGAGFEPWVKKWETSGTFRSVHIVDMASALSERGASLVIRSGVVDPHFWLDPTILEKEVGIVLDALVNIDPVHQDIFRENASRLVLSLAGLDQRFQKGLALCSVHDVVVSHDAFGYLGARYGFSVISIAGISPDEEPAPRNLALIATIAREKGVKFIFYETVASPKFSEAIAREIGGETLILNPLESLTQSEVQSGEDYVSKMEMNLNNLQKAMSCQ